MHNAIYVTCGEFPGPDNANNPKCLVIFKKATLFNELCLHQYISLHLRAKPHSDTIFTLMYLGLKLFFVVELSLLTQLFSTNQIKLTNIIIYMYMYVYVYIRFVDLQVKCDFIFQKLL